MPVTDEINELLAKFTTLATTPQKPVLSKPEPSLSDLARNIVLHAGVSVNRTPLASAKAQEEKDKEEEGPSVIERILDVMSRGTYAAAEFSRRVEENRREGKTGFNPEAIGHELAGLWEGLSGRAKTSYEDVLREGLKKDYGEDMNAADHATAFALNVLLDPLSVVGGPLVKGAAKGVKAVTGIGKKADEATAALKSAVENKPEVAGKISIVQKNPEKKPTFRELVPEADALGEKARAAAPADLEKVAAVRAPGAKVLPAEGKFKYNVAEDIRPQVVGDQFSKDFLANLNEAYAKRAAKRGKPLTPEPPVGRPVSSADDLLSRIAAGDKAAAAQVVKKVAPQERQLSDLEKAVVNDVATRSLRHVRNADKFLAPQQQYNIFQKLLARTVGKPVQRLTQATNMLREVERVVQAKGYGLKHTDGISLKLSDIIDEMGGPSKINMTDLNVWAKGRPLPEALHGAVESLRARQAIQEAPNVQMALGANLDKLDVAKEVMSPAKFENFKSQILKETQDGLTALNSSPSVIKSTQELIKKVMESAENPAQKALDGHITKIHLLSTGKAGRYTWAQVNDSVTKKLETVLGVNEKYAAKQVGAANAAFDFLASRFATFYGKKDIRQIELDYMNSARANAAARHQIWRGLIKNTSADERVNAFRAAQGALPPVGETGDAAAKQFRDAMESMFSSSQVTDKAQSVALRAGFTVADINAELDRVGAKYYFTTKGKYSKGSDWMKSWEEWDVTDDPINMMAKLETAVERLSRKNALYDDAMARWGSRHFGNEFTYRIDHPRFKGVWFPKEIATQIQKVIQHIDDSAVGQSEAVKLYDEALSIWKKSVTIYAPSHHIRNLIGDTWLSWVAGVNDPRVFGKAAKVMAAQKGRYKTLPEVEQLISGKQAVTKQRPLVTTRNGKKLTADEIYKAAFNKGLLLSVSEIEDVAQGGKLMGRIKPFGGKVSGIASAVSQNVDHFSRLAHFIHAVEHSKAKDLDAIFEEAAHTVRKWHPDGTDLTLFEKKYMKRLAGFYSWSRKAIPLVVEAMVMKPGKVTAYPKGMESLQAALGIESDGISDPFPDDQLFPEWIREKGIGPLGRTGMPGIPGWIASLSRQGADAEGNPVSPNPYTIANPSNPFHDTVADFAKNPAKVALENLNPFLKIPIELGMNQKADTEAPIMGPRADTEKYITDQIPILSVISRMTNLGPTGPTNRGDREGLGNMEAVINWLTAAGLLGTGPYIKQAQFEKAGR